jgi:UDP-N-acetylglucosamine:LPS N-acetylglucosamine transferase
MVFDKNEATPQRIESELKRLSCNGDELNSMAAKAKSIGKPNAAADLTDLILEMAGNRVS